MDGESEKIVPREIRPWTIENVRSVGVVAWDTLTGNVRHNLQPLGRTLRRVRRLGQGTVQAWLYPQIHAKELIIIGQAEQAEIDDAVNQLTGAVQQIDGDIAQRKLSQRLLAETAVELLRRGRLEDAARANLFTISGVLNELPTFSVKDQGLEYDDWRLLEDHLDIFANPPVTDRR